MEYAEIKQRINMLDVLGFYGVELGKDDRCACPLHGGDNPTAFSVHSANQGWKCYTKCAAKGDIFTFVERKEGIDNSQSKIRIMEMFNLSDAKPTAKKAKAPKAAIKSRTEYIYRDDDMKEIYKVIRVDYVDGKKDCYQECNGKPTLPESVRTLYNRHLIAGNTSDHVIICEGEKTADALVLCGFIATTNPLGSKNWRKEYAEILKGQKIVIMPDADEHGETWKNVVTESLCGIVEHIQVVNMPDDFVKDHPEYTGHDFADYVYVYGDYDSTLWLNDQINTAKILLNGVDPELLGRPCDIWADIVKKAELGISTNVFNLSEWLPSMDINVKQGDLVVLMGNTSTGKTRLLHNIPFHLRQLNFAIFDLELSKETLAIRHAAMENQLSVTEIEKLLAGRFKIKPVTVDNVFIQKIDSLTLPKIKERVELIERVTGRKIHGIAVDYIGLMAGKGTSYEVTSHNVEDFKAYIGSSDKFGILTTQVSRPENKEEGMFKCPNPFMAKNSGSIENSAQTLIGFWKDKDNQRRMYARVLKHTHGEYPNHAIPLDAKDLLITEARY